jgi:arsenate reductase-like glutaredoxin family protein
MSETVKADRLVKAYISMRDKRAELSKEYTNADKKIEEQMEMVESELVKICKDVGVDSLRTEHGNVYRTIKTTYETSDWDNMYNFIVEHNIPHVLQRRISPLNMKQFLEENPTLMPIGMNVNNKYAVTIKRK